jgi:hypothetical protein
MPSIHLKRDKIIFLFHINTYPYLIVIDLINYNLLYFFSRNWLSGGSWPAGARTPAPVDPRQKGGVGKVPVQKKIISSPVWKD